MVEIIAGARRTGKTTKIIDALINNENAYCLVLTQAHKSHFPDSVRKRVVTLVELRNLRKGPNTALYIDNAEEIPDEMSQTLAHFSIKGITLTPNTWLLKLLTSEDAKYIKYFDEGP